MYDPLDLSYKGSLFFVAGPSGTGKSVLVKNFVWLWVMKKKLFHNVVVFRGSAESDDYEYIDQSLVFDFSMPRLEKFIETVKKEGLAGRRTLVIFDDVGGKRGTMLDKDSVTPFWSNFRHSHCSIIFAVQYVVQAPVAIRRNVYVWCILNQQHNDDSEKILIKEAKCGPIDEFKKLLETINDFKNYPHVCLVIEKKKANYCFIRGRNDLPDFKITRQKSEKSF